MATLISGSGGVVPIIYIGDFEDGQQGFNITTNEGDNGSVNTTSSYSQRGNQSLETTISSPDGNQYRLNVNRTIDMTNVTKIIAYGYGENLEKALNNPYILVNGESNYEKTRLSQENTWEKLELDVSNISGQADITLYVEAYGGGSVTVRWDAIYMEVELEKEMVI